MNLNSKIINAAKWSSITEIVAKIVSPVTNMILARLLAPEAFGVVATITMIISFADMFTDAGFQKYLVQHEFKDEVEKSKAANVAFWTNLFISILIWIIIIIFSNKIAIMVGNPGLGIVIIIACIQLPLTSFSSIQMAIYKREFDFKTLFSIRIVAICIPFFVTIPLALCGLSFWALIIGNIAGVLFNAVLLTIKSKWKPKLYYSFDVLKKILSFSIWSLIEGISIWFTTWIDTFIIGSVLSSYYLGIYKNSLVTVNGIFAIVTASTTPILFSALSRVQNDNIQFKNVFFKMQRFISYLVFPMAIGIFIYSDLVVDILLGEKWGEANNVIAIWGLISGIVIILGHYSSEVYRSKGMPKLSFFAQLLHLIVLIPTCIIASKYEFNTLVNVRALIRLQFILVHIILMQFIIGISIRDMFKNVSISAIASILMGVISLLLKHIYGGIGWQIISILFSTILYLVILI
ncbi:lipopolysaccharide biosynthesis protein, partial [uncultured Clostridium sp.]